MLVNFTNLYQLIPEKKRIFKKINSLIKSSKFIGGIELKNFEKKFSKFVGTKYCIGVGNGTDALEIAVKSLNLKKGSEIIVPNNLKKYFVDQKFLPRKPVLFHPQLLNLLMQSWHICLLC